MHYEVRQVYICGEILSVDLELCLKFGENLEVFRRKVYFINISAALTKPAENASSHLLLPEMKNQFLPINGSEG